MPRTSKGTKAPAKDVTATLNYAEANTALELTLAELQAKDLDVEMMADLYRRAMAYADRCELLLGAVEQEVKLLDPTNPNGQPEEYEAPS